MHWANCLGYINTISFNLSCGTMYAGGWLMPLSYKISMDVLLPIQHVNHYYM